MMYKLQDGKLITPPVIYKGIVGYDTDTQRLLADGWKPLIVSGDGEEIMYVEHADYIEERHKKPKFDYRVAREKAYPSLGDMMDAFCKAYEGDDSELRALLAQRNIVKSTIKKTENAD